LGGRRSGFAMGRGTRFNWQHDARHLPGGKITLFDNGAGPVKTESQSRGMVLVVDRARRRVRLERAYRHPNPLLAYAMGNLQPLPDGSVMLGWGNVPVFSKFGADGSLLGDLRLAWDHDSYRGYQFPWSGSPHDLPTIGASVAAGTGARTLYASWNGATGVAGWQVSVGPSAGALSPVAVVQRAGFETAIPLGSTTGYAAVTALGPNGQPLASSRAIKL